MKFLVIPPGKFKMGENDNVVPVTLTRPFRLGVHEVTQGEFTAVMETEPWKGRTEIKVGENVAATWINWSDATEFCQKLTELERATGTLSVEMKYRLPTEAEWEWACRAGTTTAYSFGDSAAQLGEYAWYDANAQNAGEAYAHVVGLKKPNPWGLYDIHGNVWESCGDWLGEELPGGIDPYGPTEGSYRVVRGGSWFTTAWRSRSADRHRHSDSVRHYYLGFRVALSQSGKAEQVSSSTPPSTATPTPTVAPFDAAQAKQHQQAWADHLGLPVEYTNSIGMKLVACGQRTGTTCKACEHRTLRVSSGVIVD
ncbi:MAG: formylglycine-generating enzyme family protein [Rhodopirellula sp.]|nr:formylglycine-generating enzyme family protein [Rhodopirellula sp.]